MVARTVVVEVSAVRCRVFVAVLLIGAVAACGTSNDSTLDTGPVATSASSSTPSEIAPDKDATPPALCRGEQGSWVVELQQGLTRHGFPVATDDKFGPLTEDAVRAFQNANGLTVDGVVGPVTWAALLEPATAPSSPSTAAGSDTTAATTPPAAESLVLRAEGLGAVSFGDPADEVLAVLTATLGPPDEQRPLVDASGSSAPGVRLHVWHGTAPYGLTVTVADTFRAWEYNGDLGLTTESGIGIGSTAAEVLAAYPGAAFGQYPECTACSGEWEPSLVWIVGGATGLRGATDWSGGSPYELAGQALRDKGYSSPYFQAIGEFQVDQGLEVTNWLDTPTWLALGLPLPLSPDDPLTTLRAGG